jgi:plastocyanin
MPARLPTCLALLAGAASLAACGGGGTGGSAEGAASSSPCAKGAVVVHMRNIRFAPGTATVKAGRPVCWVNDDDVQHDAQAQDGQFTSVLFGKGETFTTTPKAAGKVAYVCSVHPGMTGTLTVTP